MPLFSISPNIQESSRKRTHEDFVDDSVQLPISVISDSKNLGVKKSIEEPILSTSLHHLQLSPTPKANMEPTPGSSPGLTDPGSSPPNPYTPSPNKTPSKSHAVASAVPPITTKSARPVKRKLTAAAKEQERLEKRQKKDAEAAEKAKKKAADDEAKAARAAERAKKDAEKAKKKAEDEAKRRKKEEGELAAKRKEEKQKNMLASFIKRAPTAPSKKPAEQITKPTAPEHAPPEKQVPTTPQETTYERIFRPFYVKEGVTLARSPFEMDEETKDAKTTILDEFIRGERGVFNPKPFNPIKTFEIPFPQRRGITRPSVRKIMEGIHGTQTKSESQTERLVTSAQDQLNSIPMKALSFYEDVRPAYFGTVTAPMDREKLRSLSRRPVGRVLPLNYDYDSEAEWVEDDGEDLGDDDDDEEDHEGDEEMEDFLDDSEDVAAVTRPTFLGEKEPTSTGICFEDHTRLGPSAKVYKYRMEFILGTLEHHSGIDPFSTAYWPAPKKKVATPAVTAPPAAMPLSSMAPPNAPKDAFAKLLSGTSSGAKAVEAKDLVPREMLDDFKGAIVSVDLREFSKATIVDLLAKKFPPCTKAQVKATLDRIAHRISVPGAKKSVKQWALLPAFAP
ncbi:hypothetical protein GGR53DRAFT_506037 [Hypoxylon sp. FL1150]|nr:hypothetical protein GGR53DRAFT_506037 [Hypoxylon sp. FL1150]